MTTCRWCGVDLTMVPSRRAWNGREECASVLACMWRRLEQDAEAAIDAADRRQLRRHLQAALERRCD